jgi:hypothetical protein
MHCFVLFAALLPCTSALGQSPVFGLPGTGGSPVFWPTQSGSPVIGYPSGVQTVVLTTFNEGAANTSIQGTSPTVNVHGNLWDDWPTTASWDFLTGGGAYSTSTSNGNDFNTGATSYTVTFSNITNTDLFILAFSAADSTLNDRMELWLLGSGGIELRETVSGTTTTLQTQAASDGATGSVVAVVHGTSITVTAFGQAPMTYTIPPGHADIGGPYIAWLTNVFDLTMSGVKVTVP